MSNITLWTRRDPFTEFDAMIRRAFGPAAFVPRASTSTSTERAFTPAAELARDGDDAVLRLELPGLDAEKDVSVEIADHRLVVSGERRDERSADGEHERMREVRYGSFRRSFALPAHVTADSITASYDAGVLTVTVAGAYAANPARRITITPGRGSSKAETATIES